MPRETPFRRQPCSGRRGKDNRLFIEAVLWIAQTGSPSRDLPPALGHWNSVFTRFRDWVKADVWKRLFDAVSDDPDMEYAMVDATIVKVHRHGKRGTQSQAIGRCPDNPVSPFVRRRSGKSMAKLPALMSVGLSQTILMARR